MKKIDRVLSYFDEVVPNAGCELTYNSDYGILIAVMLSAQTTDKKVNTVTDKLFAKYKSLEELDKASLADIEDILKVLGLYKNKAKHLKEIVHDLLTRFDGKVPSSKEDLMSLSGVGNKTANVVRAELFKIPEFAVDTHVNRITKRLGFVDEECDVYQVEEQMKKILRKDQYIKAHHQFIHFGRYLCKAQSPACENCKLKDICTYFKKKTK